MNTIMIVVGAGMLCVGLFVITFAVLPEQKQEKWDYKTPLIGKAEEITNVDAEGSITRTKQNGCPNKVTQKDYDEYMKWQHPEEGVVRLTGFGACVQVVPDGEENSHLNQEIILEESGLVTQEQIEFLNMYYPQGGYGDVPKTPIN